MAGVVCVDEESYVRVVMWQVLCVDEESYVRVVVWYQAMPGGHIFVGSINFSILGSRT